MNTTMQKSEILKNMFTYLSFLLQIKESKLFDLLRYYTVRVAVKSLYLLYIKMAGELLVMSITFYNILTIPDSVTFHQSSR